jgi:hypothetical protein
VFGASSERHLGTSLFAEHCWVALCT